MICCWAFQSTAAYPAFANKIAGEINLRGDGSLEEDYPANVRSDEQGREISCDYVRHGR